MSENPADSDATKITNIIHELSVLKKQNAELSQAGFKLITAQSKLHSLLHNASDGIITFAPDGTVETFNIAAQHIFGYSEGEVITRNVADLIPCPDWVEENVAAYIKYFISSRASPDTPLLGKHRMGFDILLNVSTGQASNQNTELFDADEEEDPFADNLDVVDENDSDGVMVCFFKDVTVDKKVARELEDHKHALDLAAGVIMRDKDFRVIDVNDNFCQMLGRNRTEFIGEQYIQSKLGGLSKNNLHLKQKREFLSQGNPWVGESCFLNKQNEQIWFTESATPFLDAQDIPYQYLSILINITDRKKFQSQIEQHRDHLQDLVDDQITDIKTARDAAETANKTKSEFLANMSHELRTPMHGILSFTHLCLKQFKTLPLDNEQIEKLHKFLTNIETSSQRLLTLLNDLLDLTKLESGKEEYEFCKNDLHQLCHQIKDEYSAKILEKKLDLQIKQPEMPLLVVCDKNKVLQVISNLIANAIKFSAENKQITITLEHSEIVIGKRITDSEKTKGVLVTISDQGLGIPNNELTSIFNKFIQSSKTKSGAGGTGLGLSICTEIIAAHNGKLWAENNVGEGASFKFFLPA